jgi:hypothetical protein
MRGNQGLLMIHPFVHYEDGNEDVRQRRCQIHLGIRGRKVLHHNSDDDSADDYLY